MKSLIIYYSQTGNTKKVAHAIRRGMSQLVEQCDITKVKEVKPEDVNKYDLIGLGSPVCCLLYTSPSPRDRQKSRMPSSA